MGAIFFYGPRTINALFRTAATINPPGGKSCSYARSYKISSGSGFAPRYEKNLDFMVSEVRNYY